MTLDLAAAVLSPPDAYHRGFSHHEAAIVLDRHLRRLAAQKARCRSVLGRLARHFHDRRGHHELGFARLGDYTRERLGLSARELQSLAAVSRSLERLPAVRTAFERGELSWSQVRLLIGVATPDTEAVWLALGRERTVRALAALIRDGGRPASEDENDDTEPQVRFRLRCPRRVLRLWREVVELARRMSGAPLTQDQAAEAIAAEGLAARPPCGEAWPGGAIALSAPANPEESRAVFAELDWTPVAEAIPEDVERLAIRDGLTPIAPPPSRASLTIPERQMCARPEWEWPDAEVVFSAPVSVVALFRSAILAFAHPRDSLPGGLEELLLHVKAEWESQPRHRDPVFARDGWRCAVPVCTARRELHDHHVVFRSRGGDNGRDNRITLCAWHHLRDIHAGRVRAWGDAPDGITWEIGVRAGRRPLIRVDAAGFTPP